MIDQSVSESDPRAHNYDRDISPDPPFLINLVFCFSGMNQAGFLMPTRTLLSTLHFAFAGFSTLFGTLGASHLRIIRNISHLALIPTCSFTHDLRAGARGARRLSEGFGVCSRWSAVSMTDSSCPTRGERRVGCFGTENPHPASLQWE